MKSMTINSSINNTFTESSWIQSDILYETFVYSLTIPLFLITTAGNGVILITIKYQARLLSSTSNYFILSLALADFFVGIAIMPIMIVFTAKKQQWVYDEIICDSWMTFDFLCSSASFLTLSAMSIERYKMLTTSYVHIKHSSKLRVITFICLSWLLPFVTWVPVIIVYRHLKGNLNKDECIMPADKYVVLTLCILIYHIPLICMVVFYTKLIIHIKKSSLNNLESTESFNLNYSRSLRSKRSLQLNNSLYSNPNENSVNLYDRKYSVNLEQIKVRENKIKKSNSINFTKPRFNPEIQYYSHHHSHSFSSVILNKFSIFLRCCCIQKLSSPKTLKPQQSKRSPILVKCFVDGNLNAFKINNTVINSPNLMMNKKGASMYIHDSDYSRKSSLNSNKNDFDSVNSTLTRCKIQNNSLNNFIEYQEMINNNREYSGVSNHNEKDKRFSLMSSKKNSLSVYENANYQNLRLKRNRKAARMLGLLVATFSICWLPYTIIYPLDHFYRDLFPQWFTAIAWWMGYLNSTINPFLYVYSNKNIRRSVRILFVKRLWAFCTCKKMSRNFRNDSLRNNILFGSYRNANNNSHNNNNNNNNNHQNNKLENKFKTCTNNNNNHKFDFL